MEGETAGAKQTDERQAREEGLLAVAVADVELRMHHTHTHTRRSAVQLETFEMPV